MQTTQTARAARRYDDPVEVRRGPQESPEQFVWRDRLWLVRQVVAHWVETGQWWRPSGDSSGDPSGAGPGDLLQEREVWRVEAARGRLAALAAVSGHPDADPGFGVFDLSFDWSTGDWRLAGAVD